MADQPDGTNQPGGYSRRNFIKGVIAAGAAVSSASYLFRDQRAGQAQAPARRAASNGWSR